MTASMRENPASRRRLTPDFLVLTLSNRTSSRGRLPPLAPVPRLRVTSTWSTRVSVESDDTTDQRLMYSVSAGGIVPVPSTEPDPSR